VASPTPRPLYPRERDPVPINKCKCGFIDDLSVFSVSCIGRLRQIFVSSAMYIIQAWSLSLLKLQAHMHAGHVVIRPHQVRQVVPFSYKI
jgi:hypothetical protein